MRRTARTIERPKPCGEGRFIVCTLSGELSVADDDQASTPRTRGLELAELLRAYEMSPDAKRRTARVLEIKKAIEDEEGRREERAKSFANAMEHKAAAAQAALDLEAGRHRELVDALEMANARSWRRDIAIAAISAFLGAVATVVVGLLT